MRILITASGSGGHLFCGLSIAAGLTARVPGVGVFFLGSGSRSAAEIITGRGFKYYGVRARGLTGTAVGELAGFIAGQLTGLVQTGLVLLRVRPRVVVSTGGYASFGAVLWSWILRIPCVAHEQNLVPGKANLLSRYFTDKILISFSDSKDYLPGSNNVFTGMPVRFKSRWPAARARGKLGLLPDRFTVLIMGGSKGAGSINRLAVDLLPLIPDNIQIIHLTGVRDLDYVKDRYRQFGIRAYITGFSGQMDVIYSAASMVIGRAGAGTLAEISFWGLPAVLVPYPHSRDKHQYRNAEFMARQGAAVVMGEKDASAKKIIAMIKSKDRLREMAGRSASLARPGAVDKIVAEIMELADE